MTATHKKYLLVAILVAATLLRVINLSSGDLTGSDEVFYSFRAIGPLDFDNAPHQTTPIEWQDPNIRWWTNLSMHDHPLLVFLIQHVSMGVFGENNFGFRFPSAMFGVLSVFLVYLIARRMFSDNIGLLAAALTAVTANHVYISRLGIQESYVIFFLLLCSYLFLKALDHKKYFLWTGVALGFAFLTKYICFIAVPIFLTYLLVFRRDVFRLKQFWLGVALAALVASPILIYNFELYRSVGHFDFQFSFIFGQNPDVWKSAPGKEEIGSLTDRIRNFIPHLLQANSWLFLGLTAAAFIYFILRAIQKKDRELFRRKAFIDIAIAWLVLLILFIGPTFRFLTLFTPFFAIKAAVFLAEMYARVSWKKLALVLLVPFFLWELFYSVNSEVLEYPVGPEHFLWSKARFDNYNWGYNDLEEYLNKELAGKYPLLTFDARYQFLQKIKDADIAAAKSRGDTPLAAMLIYSPTIQNAAQLWIFDRRQIYHGWPAVNSDAFVALIGQYGPGYLPKAGIHTYYLIEPLDAIPLKKGATMGQSDILLEQQLEARNFYPLILTNERGDDAFKVYKFTL